MNTTKDLYDKAQNTVKEIQQKAESISSDMTKKGEELINKIQDMILRRSMKKGVEFTHRD